MKNEERPSKSDYIERILLETHWRDYEYSQWLEVERFSRYDFGGSRWKLGQSNAIFSLYY